MAYGGIRWYVGMVYDGIRWYTGHMRVWYTIGIRLVYGWHTVVYGSHAGVVYE